MSKLTEHITEIFNIYSKVPFWEGCDTIRYDCYLKTISWIMELEELGKIKQTPYVVPTYEGGFLLSWENRNIENKIIATLEMEFRYDSDLNKVVVDHSTNWDWDDYEEEFGLEVINERVIEAVERFI